MLGIRRPAVCATHADANDLRFQVVGRQRMATMSGRKSPRSRGAKSGGKGRARENARERKRPRPPLPKQSQRGRGIDYFATKGRSMLSRSPSRRVSSSAEFA